MLMKSILFFIESLDGGGAEGVLENVVSSLDKTKFDLHVVSETDNEFRTQKVKENTRHHSFIHKNIKGSKLKEIWNKIIIKFSLVSPESVVRNFLIRGKYDIEVAFCEGYSTKIIGNSKKRHTKKIAWVHTDVLNNPWSETIFGGSENERKCYEKFDAIVCVSETIKESFIKKYGMEDKLYVIYNIINDQKTLEQAQQPFEFKIVQRPFWVLAGSFRKVKGYDRMIEVCADLRDEGYNFSVVIMGIGYERKDIENLIEKYDLYDRITLLDYQENPHKFMANADLFVCSSYAEGYSTVVSEAVLLGLPIVTTNCSGMREIFGDNQCGIICENSKHGLYKALKDVLDNPELLTHFKAEEKIRATAFSMENQIKTTETFFEEILQK